MSDSERKKRSQCIDVWEEAGSEFYQESYPGMEADLEAFQKNPNKLSTLLPSNKTRTGKECNIHIIHFTIYNTKRNTRFT